MREKINQYNLTKKGLKSFCESTGKNVFLRPIKKNG